MALSDQSQIGIGNPVSMGASKAQGRPACPNGATTMTMDNPEQARHRAEAIFKKNEAALEGQKAMEEYRADHRAMQEKSSRLRKLRLARDQAASLTAKKRSA
jgi:hypothetical protein